MWWLSLLSPVKEIFSGVFGYLNKKEDTALEKYKVDGQVDVGLIQADTTRLQALKEIQIAGMAYAGDRWMRYLFAYPLGFWWICLFFDSTLGKALHFPTTAFKLPHPADEWSGWILAYLFLHTSVMQVFKR